jgi:hypothetical protein
MDGIRYKKRGMPYAIGALKKHGKVHGPATTGVHPRIKLCFLQQIVWASRQRALSRQKRDYDLEPAFNDELWNQEWYLVTTPA